MTAATLSRFALASVLAGCGSAGPTTPSPKAEAPAAAAPGAADEPVATDLVAAELVADVTRVAPGQELALGVHLRIDDGWHIYWTNPGDSGLATSLELTAPAGYQVGEPRFAGPERFDLPGNIVNYGYAGETLISVPVIAPDQLAPGAQRFSAELTFLACQEACLPGTHQLSLELSAADAQAPSEPARRELFSRHAAQVPAPLGDAAAARWRDGAGARTLVLSFPGAEAVEYFPARGEPLTGRAIVPGDDGAELHLSYSAAPEERGVIAVTRDGTTRYFRNDVPWEDSP